jgi:hypothetical protein
MARKRGDGTIEWVRGKRYVRVSLPDGTRPRFPLPGELWTSGKLYEQHGEVRGLRPKASATQDEYRLGAYVHPVIGSKPVARVTDIEQVMAEAPGRGDSPDNGAF